MARDPYDQERDTSNWFPLDPPELVETTMERTESFIRTLNDIRALPEKEDA